MGQLQDLAFEMPRRPVRFFSQTILPNGDPMNYTKNPNDAVYGLSDGDDLVYTSPFGTLFQMDDGTYYYKKSIPNTWEVLGGSGGAGTITGATNGLSIYGASGDTIGLGGDLTGSTVIDGLGIHNLTFQNINDFQITPSGASKDITFGIDEVGLFYSVGTGATTSSITYETNQGILYGGNYHVNYDNRSLVDKEYVDLVATGLDPKSAVAVTTTVADGNLDLSGLTSPSTIDGITLVNGMRVLVKEQTDASENGIWVASASTWSRSTDFDGTPEGEVTQGAFIPVFTGDTLFNTIWILITPDPISIGVTDLNFTLLSSPAGYIAGTGITINTNTISVNGVVLAGDSIMWSGDTFNVDTQSGKLNTALNAKVDVTTFSGYTGTTQTAIDGIGNDITYLSGQTNTKLDTSIFNTYTGDTQTIITGIGNDITYLSGQTDTKLDTSIFNTYTGDTQTIITGIGNDITYLSGQTDTKLDTSIFNTYTGDTTPIINAALTGATNGIDFTGGGREVGLGGALTGDTTIAAGDNKFEVTGEHNSGIAINSIAGSRTASIYAGSGTTISGLALSTPTGGFTTFSQLSSSHVGGECVTFCSVAAGSGTESSWSVCDGSSANQIKIESNGNMTVTDAICSKGFIYGDDYENNFVARSLVTAQYVTGYTQSAVTNASNTVAVCNVNAIYTATTENDFIGVSGATCIFLPANPKSCQRITVADIEGDALSNSIQVNGNGNLINGSSIATINTDYGSMTFINNNSGVSGIAWSAVAFIN